MASLTPVQRTARPIPARRRFALRLLDDRNFLGLVMIAPAAAFLLVFLAYPLGLGFWLGMTDATIGQPGRFVGFANFISLAHDQIFWLSVFNTTLYTVVASVLKFGLGLYLALLLNRRLPLKSIIRAVVLLPFVTPTVLSAIAFWWIYDPQFSIISWSLIKLGLIHQYIDFLGQPWNALVGDRRQRLARHPVRGDNAACRAADDLAVALRGGNARRRGSVAALPLRHPADAVADHRRRHDLFGIAHVHRLPAHLRHHARGPDQRHSTDGDTLVPARHHRGAPRRGRGDRRRHGPVSSGGHPVQLFRTAAATLAARLTRLTMALGGDASEGMEYLERLPRRLVTLYLPLAVFLFVLLFPFYWMTTTTLKPDDELYDYARFNPFWVHHPTLAHIEKLFFETSYPAWLINTLVISAASAVISLFCSVCAAYAIERLRFSGARYVGLAIFLAYLVPPSILFIPLAAIIFKLGLFDSDWALILTYPTFLVPFCTWLLMGYFRTIPYELEECALIDGATRLQILWKITLPLAVPGLISAGIFAFTLSRNEFIYALTFISSSENKTVPVGAITELVEGDVYHWGSLMAAALFGSLPVVIMYSFFVECYVSSLTGAVKE
jgi:multiple sugar transport system permease protein